MSDTFNTTPANWQGIDGGPVIDSNNIPSSGGVYNSISNISAAPQGFIRRVEAVGEKAVYNPHSWIEDYVNCTLEMCFKNNGFPYTMFLLSWEDTVAQKSCFFIVGENSIGLRIGEDNYTYSTVQSLNDVIKISWKKVGSHSYFYVNGVEFNHGIVTPINRNSKIYLGSYVNFLAGYPTDYYYVKLTNDDTGEIEELINVGSEFDELTSERHLLGRKISSATGSGSDLTDGDIILTGDITLDSEITLAPNTHIRGNECVVHVSANGKLILGDGCSIEGVTFDGGLPYTRTKKEGIGYYNLVPLISVSDIPNYATYIGNEVVSILGENATIDNCRFDNIDRLCIKYNDNNQAYLVKTQPNIVNNYFYNCRCGIYYQGEFGRIIGNVFNSVVYGGIFSHGNLSMSSCIFLRCDVGMLIVGGGNPGHSEFNGLEFAHNGIAGTYVLDLPREVGDVFTGCQWADAPIIGVNCNALLVTGSRLDTWVEIAAGSANAFIANNVYKGCAYRDGKPLFGGGVIYNLKVNNAAGSDVADSEINN